MNKKKSWIFITDWYPRETDQWNGIFIWEWLHFLKDEFDFTTLVWRAKQQHNRLLIQTAPFGKELIIETKGGILTAWWFWIKFRKIIRKELPQHHPILLGPLPWSWVLKIFYLGSRSYSLSEHQSVYFPLYFQNLPFWQKWLYRLGIKNASKIMLVSNALKTHISSIQPKANCAVIPNRVSVPQLDVTPPKRKRIAIIGDLRNEVKGISQALSWMNASPFLDFERVVVGNGPDEEMLKEQFSEVTFLPAMPHPNLMEFIAETSVVVINSPFETFSILAHEVQQLGTYLLCRKNGGPEDHSSEHVFWFENQSDFEQQSFQILEKINQNQHPTPFIHEALSDENCLKLWKEALQ